MNEQTIFDLLYERKKITKPIRLIELFGGYGSQALALKYLGVSFQHWKLVEWAVKSIQAYKDIHMTNVNIDFSEGYSKKALIDWVYEKGISSNYNEPMTKKQIERLNEKQLRTIFNNIQITNNLVNIQQVKAKDLEIVDKDKYEYIMTYSFPCFTKDSLVLTNNGYKNINKIKIGDKVITHKNHYKKVINTFDNGIHDIYKINAMGVDEIKTTANHKFYVREMYRKGHVPKRYFKEPKWKETIFLSKKDYLGVPINKNEKIPEIDNIPTNEKNFWWIIGRYFGDGWYKTKNTIIICCAKNELQEITNMLNDDLKYKVYEEKSTYKIHITMRNLGNFVSIFGKGALNKHLTEVIMDLPINLLEQFLKGYFSADGCKIGKIYKATTISRELAYGIGMCISKVYKTPYKIYKCIRPKKYIIEGRKVNQHDTYQIVFKKEKCKQDKAFYENNYIWYPVKEISYIGKENVYDIEVEDDHSFTIQNTIVHNCQDLSLAGKGKGMKDTSTRSGMLWEVERILTECKELDCLPQILLMENVPQVHGADNVKDFNKWQLRLEELGYKNYWQDLIATDYGIPQTRNRCFMVSILGDYSYTFPKPIPLKLKLKDMLEDNVDEKYYLSDKTLEQISNWKSYQNPLDSVMGKESISPTITTRIAESQDGGINASMKVYCNELNKTTNLRIKNNTKKGYLEATDGDGVDISSRMEHHRGNVQKDKIQTLTTSGGNDRGVVIGTYQYSKSDNFMQGKDRLQLGKEVSDTLQTTPKEGVVTIGNYTKSKHNASRIVDKDYSAPTVMENHGTITAIIEEHNKYAKHQQDMVQDSNGNARTLVCGTHGNGGHYTKTIMNDLRIRKLTPYECFALMGVKREDYLNCAKNQSDSSLYHLAGDSIVVDVLCAIFKEMI